MKKYKERFEWLQESRPSIFRNSILVFLYKTICGLIGLLTIVVGVAMIINAAIGQDVISYIVGENSKSETVFIYKSLGWFIGMLLIITGVIAFLIYTLAGKVERRNNYIRGLEMLTDEVICYYEEEEEEAGADKKDSGKEMD